MQLAAEELRRASRERALPLTLSLPRAAAHESTASLLHDGPWFAHIRIQTARLAPTGLHYDGPGDLVRVEPDLWQLSWTPEVAQHEHCRADDKALKFSSLSDPLHHVSAKLSKTERTNVYSEVEHYSIIETQIARRFDQGSQEYASRRFFLDLDLLSMVGNLEDRGSEAAAVQRVGLGGSPWTDFLANVDRDLVTALQNDLGKRIKSRSKMRDVTSSRVAIEPEARLMFVCGKFGQLIHDLAELHFPPSQMDRTYADARSDRPKRDGSWVSQAFMNFASGDYQRDTLYREEIRLVGQPQAAQFNLQPNGIMFLAFAELADVLLLPWAEEYLSPKARAFWSYLRPVLLAANEAFLHVFVAPPHEPGIIPAFGAFDDIRSIDEVIRRKLEERLDSVTAQYQANAGGPLPEWGAPVFRHSWNRIERNGLVDRYFQIEGSDTSYMAWSLCIRRSFLHYSIPPSP